MDAHYQKVMQARQAADAATRRLYFGYSTILDRPAFEEWRSHHSYEFFQLPEGQVAEALDVELVFDCPSRWWGGRVAGLADKPGASVYGRVFEIAGNDWPIVQHKEGAVTGLTTEKEITVRIGDQRAKATAFVTSQGRRSEQGPVSPAFLEALVRGAKASELPAAYVQKLEAITG